MKYVIILLFLPLIILLLFKNSWMQCLKCKAKTEPFSETDDIFVPKYSKIPNVIWTFWEGQESELITKCIGSWKKYNPEYKVIVLNKKNLAEYLPGVVIDEIPHTGDFIQRYSDFVRVNALKTYGGIWMDASIICQKPLMWIHDIQNKSGADFIAYYRDGFTLPEYKQSAPIIENWFFACVKRSQYVVDWYDEMLRFSKTEKTENYLDSLLAENVSFQNVPPERYDYLVMYIIASAILQKKKRDYKVYLLKADDTALRHWIMHGFDHVKGAKELVEKNGDHRNEPLIKIVGVVRNELLKDSNAPRVLF